MSEKLHWGHPDAIRMEDAVKEIKRRVDDFEGMSYRRMHDLLSATLDAFGGPIPDCSLPDGAKFVWGRVEHVHRIGEYVVVEYTSRDGKRLFHPYVGKEDTCLSEESLDGAIIAAIGYKAEGPNGQAAYYFRKMITNDD